MPAPYTGPHATRVSRRTDAIALRVISGYALALRDLYYERATLEDAVRLVTEHALDPS